MKELMWWGYLHTEGTVHLKRYFSPDDIIEAEDSPFVQAAFGPFPSKTREEAETKLKSSVADYVTEHQIAK
jgi:hypothetical protein